MKIKIIIKIHDLIRTGRTGNPSEFAYKTGVSKRTLYEYISFMKNELNAPIYYNRSRESYEYFQECNLKFVENYNEIKRENWSKKKIIECRNILL